MKHIKPSHTSASSLKVDPPADGDKGSKLSIVSGKRLEIESSIAELEARVYNLESEYLAHAKFVGSIIDSWGSDRPRTAKRPRNGQGDVIDDKERIFSLSSVTAFAHCEQMGVRKPHRQ